MADDFFAPVFGPQPEDDGTVLQLHRVKMVNGFQITGSFLFDRFLDFLLHAIDDLLHFDFFLQTASSQSTPVTFEA